MKLFQVEYLKAPAFRYFLLGFFVFSTNASAKSLQLSWRESRLDAIFNADGEPDFLFEDYVLFNCPAAGEAGVLARTRNKADLFSAFYGLDLSRRTSVFFGTGFLQINTESVIEAAGVDPAELEADLNAIGCRSKNSRVTRGLTDAIVSVRNEQRLGSLSLELSMALNVPLDQNPLIVGEPGRRLSVDLALTPSYGKKIIVSFPLEFRLNFPSTSFDRTLGTRVQASLFDVLFSVGILRIEQFGAESIYQNNGSFSLNHVFDALISLPTETGAFSFAYQKSLSGINALVIDSFEVSLVLFKL
jgi:hypothetical protein